MISLKELENYFKILSFYFVTFNTMNIWMMKMVVKNTMKKKLGNVKNKEAQRVIDDLNALYERKFVFVLPYPGDEVAEKSSPLIADMRPKFKHRTMTMVEKFFDPSRLQVKRVKGVVVKGKDMIKYIPSVVKCFEDNKEFAPEPLQTVCRKYMIKMEVDQVCEMYDDSMKKAFVDNRTGYSNDKLDALHTESFEKVKKDLCDRIKREDVVKEITEKCLEPLKNIFNKYKEKNEFLVESEKKRVQMIEREAELLRLHEAELQKQKDEAEKKRVQVIEREAERVRLHNAELQKQKDEAEKMRVQMIEREAERVRLHNAELQKQKDEAEEQRRIQNKNDAFWIVLACAAAALIVVVPPAGVAAATKIIAREMLRK